ncbi:MAG TPA: DinB family protein [Pyrinomonadaceae bacterium]|jgi:hypothetical protein
MPYHSVAEILDSIDATRERLRERLESLNQSQQTFRPTPDAWTVAEIAEHLSIIEKQMVQLVGMMLKKTEAAGILRADGDSTRIAPVNIDDFVAQSKTQKFVAPETVRPSGQVSVADSLAHLRETRAALHSLRPRIEQIDGTAAQFKHPFMGMLNIYQWLLFIGAHEQRHIDQIERLMQQTASNEQ